MKKLLLVLLVGIAVAMVSSIAYAEPDNGCCETACVQVKVCAPVFPLFARCRAVCCDPCCQSVVVKCRPVYCKPCCCDPCVQCDRCRFRPVRKIVKAVLPPYGDRCCKPVCPCCE